MTQRLVYWTLDREVPSSIPGQCSLEYRFGIVILPDPGGSPITCPLNNENWLTGVGMM